MRSGEDAEADAEQRGHNKRSYSEHGAVAGSADDQRTHRPPVLQRFAEVEPHSARHPQAPLLERRTIEVEARARRRDLRPRRTRPQRDREIAGRQARQEERRRRGNENEEDGEDDATDEEPRHQGFAAAPSVTLSESAFHSTCGRITDGTTPRSRTLCA